MGLVMLGSEQKKILYSMSTGIFDARGLRIVSNVTNPKIVIQSLVEKKFIKEIRFGHFVFYKRTTTGRASLNKWENKNG